MRYWIILLQWSMMIDSATPYSKNKVLEFVILFEAFYKRKNKESFNPKYI